MLDGSIEIQNPIGMRAETVREWIKQHKNEAPYPFRVENDVNWMHIDVRGNIKGISLIRKIINFKTSIKL